MKRVVAIAIAGIVATSATGRAADLFGAVPPPTVFGQPTEITSGWYLRGDVGFTDSNTPTIVPQNDLIPVPYADAFTGVAVVDPPYGDATHNVGATRGNNENSFNPSFDAGFGYRFNENFRIDATYNYWTGAAYSSGKLSTLCPSVATPVTNQVVTSYNATTGAPVYSTVPAGYDWLPNGCNGYVNARQFNQTALVNAYYDIGNFWGITPYVGAGVGLNANIISGSSKLYNVNDGSGYAGDTSATSSGTPVTWVTQTGWSNGQPYYSSLASQNVTFGQQNWNRNIWAIKYNFAWALMGGVSYQISHNLYIDLGYRYLSAPIGNTANNSQEVHAGFRLMAY